MFSSCNLSDLLIEILSICRAFADHVVTKQIVYLNMDNPCEFFVDSLALAMAIIALHLMSDSMISESCSTCSKSIG